MERFRLLADGKTVVTLFNEINRALLDIIASVCFFAKYDMSIQIFSIFLYFIYFTKQVGFGMNIDSINDPKNDLNHYIYEGVKGFYRITFEPFLQVLHCIY